MSLNHITLANISNFNVSGATLSLNAGGNIILASVLSNPVTLTAKFSLPRTADTNFGSRIQALAFNYILNLGGISTVTATMTRQVMIDNTTVTTQSVNLNSPSPAFNTSAGSTNNRPVVNVTSPAFDNQDVNTTIFYIFTLTFNFSGLLSLVSMTINSLEIEYDYALTINQPLPATTQNIVVNKGGNNSTGTGTFSEPFLTIAAAVASVNDVTPNKRYTIQLGPGLYSENLAIPANFNIVGTAAREITELSGTITINSNTWTVSGDNKSSVSNVTFSNASSLSADFTAAPATDGKLAFNNCNFVNGAVVTAAALANNVTFEDCIFTSGSLSQSGGSLSCVNCRFLAGLAIECNSAASIATTLNLHEGTSIGGDVRLIHTDTHANLVGNIIGFNMKAGAIDVRGAGATANITSTAVTTPLLITGTPTVNFISKATGIGYDPGVPEHWFDTPPSTIQQAIDRIVASLQGGTPIFSYFKKRI
jgi:hypothetical protein